MSLLVRAILVTSLLVQPFGGLLLGQCVVMPEAAALASVRMTADSKCGCCRGDGASDCPMAANGIVECNCASARPQDPKTPPSEQKSRQIEHLLPATPLVTTVLLPQSSPMPRSTAIERVGYARSHSVQSLLCVWLM